MTPSQGLCAKGRNSVSTCNFGVLAPGASARATVSAALGSAGPATAQASLQVIGASDPDVTNNVSRLVVDVAPGRVDLQLSGSATSGSPDAGAAYGYRFQVRNQSRTSGATAARVSIALPAGATFVSATQPCTLGEQLVCELGAVPVKGQVDLEVAMLAPPTAGTAMTTAATVSHSGGDPVATNDVVVIAQTTR